MLAVIVTLLVGLPACNNAPATFPKPMVAVVTPADGARYEPGAPILLTIAAAASRNVARIELSVEGRIVATQVNPEPSPTFSTRVEYTPQAQGRLQFAVAAIDATGVSSDPFTLTVIVGEEFATTTMPLPDVANQATGVVNASGCTLSAAFIQDVNVPDGTPINAGVTFTKTWRIKNTSTCDWGEGYTIAFIANTPMHPTGSEPVRPTPSNATVNINVPLTAPAQSGVYTSTWRLRDPNDQPFGDVVFVVIRVP